MRNGRRCGVPGSVAVTVVLMACSGPGGENSPSEDAGVGGDAAEYRTTVDPLTAQLEQRLVSSSQHDDDKFGYSVAIDGDRAVIGSPGDGHSRDLNTGSASVFEYTNGSWTQFDRLTASPQQRDQFGASVAIDGDTVVVGAPWENYRGYTEAGPDGCGCASTGGTPQPGDLLLALLVGGVAFLRRRGL